MDRIHIMCSSITLGQCPTTTTNRKRSYLKVRHINLGVLRSIEVLLGVQDTLCNKAIMGTSALTHVVSYVGINRRACKVVHLQVEVRYVTS